MVQYPCQTVTPAYFPTLKDVEESGDVQENKWESEPEK